VLYIYPEQVITLVYGSKEFGEAVPVLRVFAFVLLVRYAAETPALMLTTSRRQIARMVIVVSAVIFNYVLNAYLIPRYGTMGAATASLVTNTLVGIGYMGAAWPVVRQWKIGFRSLVPVCLVVLLGLFLWDYRAISMWYSLPVMAAAYSLVFYYIGYSKEERATVFAGLIR